MRSLTVVVGLIATIVIIMGTTGVAFAVGPPDSASQDMTASLAITGSSSSLAIAAPASLAFTGATMGGSAQDITNTAGSFLLDVTDPTGLVGGWDVSLGATTFVHDGNQLSNDGTLSMTGLDVTDLSTSNSATQQDSSVTAAAAQFPVAITTASSNPMPTPIYSAGALSGIGSFQLDTQLSLYLPANTVADTYSSTMTVAIASSIG